MTPPGKKDSTQDRVTTSNSSPSSTNYMERFYTVVDLPVAELEEEEDR